MGCDEAIGDHRRPFGFAVLRPCCCDACDIWFLLAIHEIKYIWYDIDRAISLNLFLTLLLNYLLITIGIFLAIDVDAPDSVEMMSKLVFTLPVGWSLLLRIKEALLVPEMPRDRYVGMGLFRIRFCRDGR